MAGCCDCGDRIRAKAAAMTMIGSDNGAVALDMLAVTTAMVAATVVTVSAAMPTGGNIPS